MHLESIRYALGASLLASLVACGGGSSGTATNAPVTPMSVNVPLLISDASSEDWATIGIKILSVAFVPQGGGSNVTVYTAPSPVPTVNLVQLDNLAEVIGNPSIPVGTYTGAVVTVSGDSGDVDLITAAQPEAGFPVPGGTSIPSADIQIQNTIGGSGSMTVPVKVNFEAPITVAAGQTMPVDLEFDLAHPAFLLGHTPPPINGAAVATLWAVNLDGPVRHHPIDDITRLVLRHTYGNVTGISADNTSITIMNDLPTHPIVTPETATATGNSLTILADAANGTYLYDVDAKTRVTIKDFSTEATALSGKYVRIAARYQQNGSLVATRIWASSTFNSVWISPEGHVDHVDTTNNLIAVSNENGVPVSLLINGGTEFFFRTPQDALADATPIGTGPGFLTNLVRGFKIHATVVDPLATPLVAQTVDIETARYDGKISNANPTNFTYTRTFMDAPDDYTVTLDYIAGTSANGRDANGNAITGFKYWNFAYPTLLTDGTSAVSNFVASTNGGVNFGGTVGSLIARGVTWARWGDAANVNGWSAPWTVLEPTPIPLGTVATGLANNAFTMTVLGGTMPATIEVSSASGSATLVYQVDRSGTGSGAIVTVSPEDITTSAGLSALTNGLAVGASVRVAGLPQADGTVKAYVVAYFTGTAPTN